MFRRCICSSGIQYWFKEDKRHRDDGPAVIYPDGTEFWYKYSKPYEPSAHELMTWKMKQTPKNKQACFT